MEGLVLDLVSYRQEKRELEQMLDSLEGEMKDEEGISGLSEIYKKGRSLQAA